MNLNTHLYDVARVYRDASTNERDALISILPVYDMVDPIYHTVIDGESLKDISLKYYGNHNLWFIVAAYNRDKFINPLELPVGVELVFPNKDDLQTMNYGN